ncbi:uncharacterized protein C6orf47 homolog [Gouania willdenowi]|uniref:Uncharacterized protein n=1 Tax=Gouania willdenowi TaxID=441366 RepID=A0A8C5DG91_GOUWI|nr:uncharacterized protein C6orf47 homolog [Gouania willdenowi]
MAGRAWGWLRSWGDPWSAQDQKERGCDRGGWSSWLWGWGRGGGPPEEDQFWEAQEKVQVQPVGGGQRWWTTSYWWGRKPGHRAVEEVDGDFSDYTTPPASPTPPSRLPSPFRLFTHSWDMEVHPHHYEICFNFLRHLFDLFVVGFLWTVSPPTKLVLELLGVQGPLRLWLHGMAMFVVSTTGMGGLLWLIQDYLPQFALIYGIIQAAVISVSLRQSVMLSVDLSKGGAEGGAQEGEQQENVCVKDTKKTL